jgi:hypothetical protein
MVRELVPEAARTPPAARGLAPTPLSLAVAPL